jgi:DNA (cytosine-5)-methyltransferase 1
VESKPIIISSIPSDDGPRTTRQSTGRIVRNGPIKHPFVVLEQYSSPGMRLKTGRFVEFRCGDTETDFLGIQTIMKNLETGELILRGHLFRRTKRLGNLLKRSLNELVLQQDLDDDDDRPARIQAQIDVPFKDVVKIRGVILTHEEYPIHSFHENTHLNPKLPGYLEMKKSISSNDVLVCRWVYNKHYQHTEARLSKKRCIEGGIRRVYMNEADELFGRSAPSNEEGPHNKRIASSGSSTWQMEKDRNLRHMNNVLPSNSSTAPRQILRPKYRHQILTVTYSSGCAGGGGDLTGAVFAGAKPLYAWDRNANALVTLSLNHPTVKIYETEAVDFPGERGCAVARTHILHLSWPCQVYSPAHTKPGKDDDKNDIAIFGTCEKLKTSDCLISTGENTSGLFRRHPGFWGLYVQEYLRAGHNLRWKICRMEDYGAASKRERLLIYSARYVHSHYSVVFFTCLFAKSRCASASISFGNTWEVGIWASPVCYCA